MASRRLPVITLVVAAAAAVLSVFAIANDDVGAPAGVRLAVQQPATRQPTTQQPVAPASVHRNVDGCGRPIVRGQDSCW
jgi:apolipoprotein N-acyltransferase